MTLRNRPSVRKKMFGTRNGRGLSRGELKKAGLTFKQALQLGLPIDARRRTTHDGNVELAKKHLKSVGAVKKIGKRSTRSKRKSS